MKGCFRKLLLFICLFRDFKIVEYLFPNLWLANYSETPITWLLGKFYFTFKGEQSVFSENLETPMRS